MSGVQKDVSPKTSKKMDSDMFDFSRYYCGKIEYRFGKKGFPFLVGQNGWLQLLIVEGHRIGEKCHAILSSILSIDSFSLCSFVPFLLYVFFSFFFYHSSSFSSLTSPFFVLHSPSVSLVSIIVVVVDREIFA